MKNLPFACSLLFALIFFSANVWAQPDPQLLDSFLNDSAVKSGHAGISVYDPATGKYLLNYNAEKNFVPSSNVKLFTLYAGLKYLGDSIPGLMFRVIDDSTILISPTGDPTFLSADFSSQPVREFLTGTKKNIWYNSGAIKKNPAPFGDGWLIDDLGETYMPPRSAFPLFGNLVTFTKSRNGLLTSVPALFRVTTTTEGSGSLIRAVKKSDSCAYCFRVLLGRAGDSVLRTPMPPPGDALITRVLADTIRKPITMVNLPNDSLTNIIFSRPVDSLFRPMIFNSDNFFAEQTLFMVSNKYLGYMNDEDIIDSLLKNDLADLPTKPRWVDGSGLSRYNLFSPQDLVYIINKLINSFGIERMEHLLPTGGDGTLRDYFHKEVGNLFAKTGSMSNNYALSGFLFTRKRRMLIFSVMINDFSGNTTPVRLAVQTLLDQIYLKN